MLIHGDKNKVLMKCAQVIDLWAKSLKKQSAGVRFCKFGTENIMPYYQKYTPTDCFFYDFADWVTV